MPPERLVNGCRAEQRCAAYLQERGWQVVAFGQTRLGAQSVALLQSLKPPVGWRWLPDLLVWRRRAVYLVDVKWAPETMPNVTIEVAATNAHGPMRAFGLPIVYLVECGGVWRACPHEALHALEKEPLVHHNGTGSGTPYHKYAKKDWLPWERVLLSGGRPGYNACGYCDALVPLETLDDGWCQPCRTPGAA